MTAHLLTSEPAAGPAAAETVNPADRRTSKRRRVLKAGIISYNGHQAVLECSVRDISEGGARLLLTGIVSAPEAFALNIETDGMEADCHVMWRRDKEIGVKFASTPRQVDKKPDPMALARNGMLPKPTLRRQPKS